MHPRERILQTAGHYKSRGLPIPTDVLAEADRLGLIFNVGQPEGDDSHGDKERPIPKSGLHVTQRKGKIPSLE